MRISHEAIYHSLFIQGRGALKRELVACLRTGRSLREPRLGRRTSRKVTSARTWCCGSGRPKRLTVPFQGTGRVI